MTKVEIILKIGRETETLFKASRIAAIAEELRQIIATEVVTRLISSTTT